MDKTIFNKRAEVIISKELQAQITLMHSQCPTNKEWSGLMTYKVTEGNVSEFIQGNGNLELTCEKFFLMDFGDATFTSFEGSEDWIKFFELFPMIDPTREDKNNGYYIGKLHSHHNMNSFHSGTDTQDLLENAPKMPMFLSLVVDYACNPFAEIAISYEVEEKWTFKKWMNGTFKGETQKKHGNIVIPCDVFYSADAYLLDQLEVVKDRNKKKTTIYSYTPPKGQQTIGFDYDEWKRENKKEKDDGKLGTKCYSRVLNALPDLILLGEVGKQAPPAFKALSDADDYVTPQSLTTYSKAFKEYFEMYWFESHFMKTNHTREDVIEAAKNFCTIQSQVWLARELNKILDELKTEVSILRTV